MFGWMQAAFDSKFAWWDFSSKQTEEIKAHFKGNSDNDYKMANPK